MFRRAIFYFFVSIIMLISITNSYAEIVLEDIEGNSISTSTLKWNWVFINFWASWCNPCVEEIAELNRFYAENKSNHVKVFAVNYEAPPLYKQQRLVRKFNIKYPSLQYRSVKALHLGNVSVVPVTFVFTPEGKFSTVLYGGQTLKSLTAAIS